MGEHEAGSLPVDWEALAVAVENQLPGVRSFLERSTGKLRTLRGEAAVLPDDSGDWIEVERRPSRDGYRTMQRFLEKVEDEALRTRLTTALQGKGAFRRFKDILLDVPDLRQEWFAFKDAEVFRFVREWLQSLGLTPAGDPPARITAASAERDERAGSAVREAAQHSDWKPGDEADWRRVVAAYDRPDRIFEPARTALLIVDMQRVFADPRGSSFLPGSQPVLKRLQGLIEAWRTRGLPLFFTRHIHRQPKLDGGAMARWWRSLILDGSWESELVDELQPGVDETVLTKCRYSAFAGTPLEAMLRAAGVEAVLIGGVMTHLCCETTARDAFMKDFDVYFLGDGTASADAALHLSSICTIAHGFGRVLSVEEAALRLDG